jgi:sirohydrochlorin ferrochelatase
MARIDAANGEDPNLVVIDGTTQPAELLYSQRMSATLDSFVPEASEALKLAARAQHLKRWTIPRSTYPMDRTGYHRWRGELKRKHAEWTSAILAECGINDDTTKQVARLIRKEDLKTDPEAQALEDVACLVFLQHYAAEFASKHDRAKMLSILRKTWGKMSEAGQRAARGLPLDDAVRALVDEALATDAHPATKALVPTQDVAVILAAHGDRGGDKPNATLLSHCEALAASADFCAVSAGILKGDPTLEDAVHAALQSGARCIAVYPMFMAEGYFTKKVLAQRLAALEIPVDVHVLPPLGADPRLPSLMLSAAVETASAAGIAPQTARLLVVGHGSQIGPASADATRAVARAIEQQQVFANVETAFLEEPEFVDEALKRAPSPTVVTGFFSGDGLHAAEDVPEAIASSGATAVYAGSIGKSLELPSLIRSAIKDHFGAA